MTSLKRICIRFFRYWFLIKLKTWNYNHLCLWNDLSFRPPLLFRIWTNLFLIFFIVAVHLRFVFSSWVLVWIGIVKLWNLLLGRSKLLLVCLEQPISAFLDFTIVGKVSELFKRWVPLWCNFAHPSAAHYGCNAYYRRSEASDNVIFLNG